MKPVLTRRPLWPRAGVFMIAAFIPAIAGNATPAIGQEAADKVVTTAKPSPDADIAKNAKWKPLQGHWEACEFGGDGPIEITDKLVEVGYGDPLTGVRWKDVFPKDNFEIEVEARRTDGFDFFCALTFPVAETHCTFVLGGWGGGVMGLSNVDGYDASDNPTTQFRVFEDNQWYRVRVRVTPESIVCWIDDKQVIEQARKDHEFGIRFEMDPCVPLGLAAYQCDAEYRNLRWRPLAKSNGKPAEVTEK